MRLFEKAENKIEFCHKILMTKKSKACEIYYEHESKIQSMVWKLIDFSVKKKVPGEVVRKEGRA